MNASLHTAFRSICWIHGRIHTSSVGYMQNAHSRMVYRVFRVSELHIGSNNFHINAARTQYYICIVSIVATCKWQRAHSHCTFSWLPFRHTCIACKFGFGIKINLYLYYGRSCARFNVRNLFSPLHTLRRIHRAVRSIYLLLYICAMLAKTRETRVELDFCVVLSTFGAYSRICANGIIAHKGVASNRKNGIQEYFLDEQMMDECRGLSGMVKYSIVYSR